MKNHWLDKKTDKEIDAAFEQIVNLDKPCFTDEEFKDTEFVDIRCNNFFEKHDRAVVTEILLYYKNEPHWIDKVLSDIGYSTPVTLGNLTIDTTNAVMFGAEDNFTITLGDKWPDLSINTSTVSGNIPGVDGIKLEVKTSEFGQICSTCNEEMWPMNTATTMMQGDPMCACNGDSCNLGIFYPDNSFIQNEQLWTCQSQTHLATFQTMYTPVVAGTMTGTVYPTPGNRNYGYVFYVSSSGEFNFTRFVTAEDGKVEYANGCSDPWQKSKEITLEEVASDKFDDRFMGWYDEVYVPETNINLVTGVLEFHYHMGKCPEIFVSYEYGREC